MKTAWYPLTKQQLYDYLDRSYNAPIIRTEDDEEHFSDEWWSLRGDLIEILSLYGKQDALGDGDFCVADSRMTSRGISVSVESSEMISEQLVLRIVDMLQGAPEAYSIAVFSENAPFFHLFVERERLLIECTSCPELADHLNLRKEDAQQAETLQPPLAGLSSTSPVV